MKALAVILWVLASICAGFIPAGIFAARDGKRGPAAMEIVSGTTGAAGLAWAGAVAW